MGFVDSLLAQGYTPVGTKPKRILPAAEGGDGEPGYYETDPASRLMRVLTTQIKQQQLAQQKKQKTLKDQTDMYQTLRDAGYDPKQAHEAVIKNSFPQEEGGQTEKEKTKEVERKATEQRTEYYKKKMLEGPQTTVRDRILKKIADGEELTAGEQKVYDDTIKKSSSGLDDLVSGDTGTSMPKPATPAPASTKKDMVRVRHPDGRTGTIPRSQLAAALKQGFKQVK